MAHSNSTTSGQTLPKKEGYTLYVSNWPVELNEIGLQEIFGTHGKLIGFMYRGGSWAYVSYSTYAEAENAIKDLHNQCPLYLSVSFAKERQVNKCGMQLAAMDLNQWHDNTTSPHASKSQGQSERKKESPAEISRESSAPEPASSASRGSSATRELQSNPTTMRGFSKHVDPNDSTNILWSKGQVTITQDGRRHVSLGRGFTSLQVPNQLPTVGKLVDSILDNSYTHGENKISLSTGKCNSCSKETKYTCEGCNIFYCGRSCQIADWPTHRIDCKAIPRLVPLTAQSVTEKGRSFNQGYNSESSLRRPKTNEQQCNQNTERTFAFQNSNDYDSKKTQREINNIQRDKVYGGKLGVKTQQHNDNNFKTVEATVSNSQASGSASKTAKNLIRPPLIKKRNQMTVDVELRRGVYKVIVSSSVSNNKQLNTDINFETLLHNMQASCNQARMVSNFKPSKGELVCGQMDNGPWIRGCVTEFEPRLIIYDIDAGRTVNVKTIQPCAEEYTVMEALCILSDPKNTLINTTLPYQVNDIRTCKDQLTFDVQVLVEPVTYVQATLKPCMPERKALQYVTLKSETENFVCISAYHRPNKVFVRSLETDNSQRYHRLMQDTEKFALSAPPLKELPNIGDLVIARYIDNNHYRAIVTNVTNETISIFYADFGNTEETNLSSLRVIPENLKQYRTCITPLFLKDVPNDVPFTKECNNYLVMLTGQEEPLLCTIVSAKHHLGYLKRTSGTNVCDGINERLKPSWKKTDSEDEFRCYTLRDIDVMKLGNVGDVVNVGVLIMKVSSGLCYLFPTDCDLVGHILETMAGKMQEYGKSSGYYIPRIDELCLVLSSGVWYRAVCLEQIVSSEGRKNTVCSVFFLDYAQIETVEHENIRYLPKDFLEPAALANMCQIVNLAPKDSNGQFSPQVQKRLGELATPWEEICIKIVDYDEDNAQYSVELPKIRDKLREEGLISP